MSETPPAQAVSDDELVEALRQVCEKRGLPVAPTRLIAEVDGIDIQQQTIKRRLDKIDHRVNSMKVGRGKVWWVPDNMDPVGDVDVSAIDWKQIDPEDIPLRKIENHPEFDIPSYWESWGERANTIVSTALIPTLAGFIVFALQDADPPFLNIGRDAATFGALVAMAGVVFVMIGICIGFVARIGGTLSAYGVGNHVQTAKERVKERLENQLPFSISWDE